MLFRVLTLNNPDIKQSPRATFVPVDDLPLHFRSSGSGRTNPMDRRPMDRQPFTVGVPPHLFQFSQDHETSREEFPIYQDAFTGGGDRSVRRMSGVTNVTTRETKRPKERSKDKEYRRMTLTHAILPHIAPSDLASAGIGQASVGRQHGPNRQIDASPDSSVPSPSSTTLPTGGPQTMFASGPQPEANSLFEIQLVHEGWSVAKQVSARMPVIYLVFEASATFGLEPDNILLLLFSMTPMTLDRTLTLQLQGPPRVTPNSTVFVFQVPGQRTFHNPRPSYSGKLRSPDTTAFPKLHSKLLSTFKLPKFDGTPKAWKQWDRDFIRFLGLHQLEHVLNEDFPSLLPHPDAVASNKMVYFLVEEAVLPGTLAAKYVRQAPLWHGHQAYVLLYNGFVFSGPQTATVLMAELSNMRFLAGETGTAFCLRLTELLEDLEHIPGSSAVVLNDTQKLGYLLSAIRHEKDLAAVYVQLQTDQLRGRVTFEQACQELHFRCEALRADNLLDTKFKPTRALILTEIKHLDKEKVPCLAKGCAGMIVSFLPLCKGCFLQCKSGKVQTLELRDGLGVATYNTTTSQIGFPAGVPKSRLPGKRSSKTSKKAMVFHVGRVHSALISVVSDAPPLLTAETTTVLLVPPLAYPLESAQFGTGDIPATTLGRVVAADSVVSPGGVCPVTIARCLAAVNSSRAIFYVDSGAGQSLCSIGTAFSALRPCRVEVTGVAGSLLIYGCGTASFVVHDYDGRSLILVIHNCLYGRCEFNLLSVSQFHQITGNRVDFSLASPAIVLGPSPGVVRPAAHVPLVVEDALFPLEVEPLGEGDSRSSSLPKYVFTPCGEFTPSDSGEVARWQTNVLAMGSSSTRLLAVTSEECHNHLATFCDDFLAPPSIPPARRLYDVKSQEDMAQLSIRFLGASADRLVRTVEISNGLKSPASTKSLRIPPLPSHLFPQGHLKVGKSPKVKKGKVGNLHHAGIAEVVFTDTFESGDSRRKYCQVFYDYVSRFGYVTAMRSKTEIGDAFADFCCQCWVPLILVRDNAGENLGGSLIQELRARNVRSAFICPYRSQQNFAEGFIGRITVMASFGMVLYSGAPLFMWVHAIKTAEFVNNITANYYSRQDIWATPYELVHGERFPDASVVVPFGCAALILLDEDEQAKFKSRCTLMLFMHYADRHPLFVYAFYSPKTKRIVYRPDCIFLPAVFPMRQARSLAGLHPDGETLVTYRSPSVMRDGPSVVSFQSWSESDPLPSFDDDVTGFELFSEGCFPDTVPVPRSPVHPGHCPEQPEFASSFVKVPAPAIPSGPSDLILQPGPVPKIPPPRRSSRVQSGPSTVVVPAAQHQRS